MGIMISNHLIIVAKVKSADTRRVHEAHTGHSRGSVKGAVNQFPLGQWRGGGAFVLCRSSIKCTQIEVSQWP